MYQLLDQSSDKVIGIRVSQQLTKEDYETLIPLWENAIQEHGKIRMLWLMDDFKGWSPEALLEDLKFDFKHNQEVERLAVVGQNWWEDWMTQVTDLVFTQSDARYFEPDKLQEAWDWVRGERTL